MNTVDIILSILLLLGFVRGFLKGFLIELAGLVALVLGIYGAIHFSDRTEAFLQTFIGWEEQYLGILAFAITFICIVVAISLVGKILTKMLSMIALGIVNRIIGAVFGLLKMAFFSSILIMFLNQSPFALEEETIAGSILYPPVESLAPLLLPTILENVKKEELLEPSPEEA